MKDENLISLRSDLILLENILINNEIITNIIPGLKIKYNIFNNVIYRGFNIPKLRIEINYFNKTTSTFNLKLVEIIKVMYPNKSKIHYKLVGSSGRVIENISLYSNTQVINYLLKILINII